MRFLTSALLLNATLASSAIAQSANPDFTRCIEGLRSDARAARVQDEAFTRFTQGLTPDLSVIVKAREGGADYIYALLTGYVPFDKLTPAQIKALRARGVIS